MTQGQRTEPPRDDVERARQWLLDHALEQPDGDVLVPTSQGAARALAALLATVRAEAAAAEREACAAKIAMWADEARIEVDGTVLLRNPIERAAGHALARLICRGKDRAEAPKVQCPAILHKLNDTGHDCCQLRKGHGGEHEGVGGFTWHDEHARASRCEPPSCPGTAEAKPSHAHCGALSPWRTGDRCTRMPGHDGSHYDDVTAVAWYGPRPDKAMATGSRLACGACSEPPFYVYYRCKDHPIDRRESDPIEALLRWMQHYADEDPEDHPLWSGAGLTANEVQNLIDVLTRRPWDSSGEGHEEDKSR